MSLQNNIRKMSNTKKMVFLALLLSMALVLSYFERFIQIPIAFPGVKLGLANIITLLALYLFGFRESLALVIMRVMMNAIFAGNIMSFWYSLSGGILSLVVMYLCIRFFEKRISTVGISVIGALGHNVGQLIVVAIVTSSIQVAVTYFPILAVSAVITGVFIGFTVKFLYEHILKL